MGFPRRFWALSILHLSSATAQHSSFRSAASGLCDVSGLLKPCLVDPNCRTFTIPNASSGLTTARPTPATPEPCWPPQAPASSPCPGQVSQGLRSTERQKINRPRGRPAPSPVRRFGMPGGEARAGAGLRSRGEAAAGFWKAKKSGHRARTGSRGHPAVPGAPESGEDLNPSFLCAPAPLHTPVLLPGATAPPSRGFRVPGSPHRGHR